MFKKKSNPDPYYLGKELYNRRFNNDDDDDIHMGLYLDLGFDVLSILLNAGFVD